MNTQKNEFDRTFLKTHKSRSIEIALQKNQGFTLIELLVVVSIIALLSTVVFAAVQDARTKAKNTAKNNLVLEYVKALELYRENNNTYPTAGTGQEIVPKCLGYTESENCHSTFIGSLTINNSIENFLPENFSHKDSLIINIGGLDREMRGVTYKCSSSTCTSYVLTWYLKGTLSNCLDKATSGLFPNSSTGPHKICTYTLK